MPETDLICVSHLRWDHAPRRVTELVARAARDRRVFFVEDAVYETTPRPYLSFRRSRDGVLIAVPTLQPATGPRRGNSTQRELINHLLGFQGIRRHVLWLWNSAALAFTDHLASDAIVHDCLDPPVQRGTPAPLDHELLVLGAADVVFTSTSNGYQAKRALHPNVHLLPDPEAGDPAGWDRVWAAAERQIDRAAVARQTPLAIAK
jgi:UDP-galactopyranose mutase